MTKILVLFFLGFFIFFSIAFVLIVAKIYLKELAVVSILLGVLICICAKNKINDIQDIHASEYLISYPCDNMIAVKITCDISRVNSRGSVGDEWSFEHYLNNINFYNGDTLLFPVDMSFVVHSVFTENDSIDDIGKAESETYKCSVDKKYTRPFLIVNNVRVYERGGRRNAGSFVDFQATYTFTRVVPDYMDFWDIYYYTDDHDELWFCQRLHNAVSIAPITGTCFALFCIILDFRKNKKARLIKKQEQIKQWEQDRLQFLERMSGRTIKEVAGIPSQIEFVNNLPVDRIDHNDEEYGSYTVYVSHNGHCYHSKRGCSSSNIPRHIFQIHANYRPCQRCCRQPIPIPQWYTDYLELKKLADKFNYK